MRNKALVCVVPLLALAAGTARVPALAATPSFTITASSVTMSPSSGRGTILFTLTAVNGYTGLVNVGCTPPTPPVGGNIPTCNAPEPYGSGFDGVTMRLTAQEPVAKNGISLYALPPSIAPIWLSQLDRPAVGGAAGFALAAAVMLGFGFRRRRLRWPMQLLLAMVMLFSLAGIVACGAALPNGPTLTPGTYTYTVWAVGTNFSTSTKVTVTVPKGVVVL